MSPSADGSHLAIGVLTNITDTTGVLKVYRVGGVSYPYLFDDPTFINGQWCDGGYNFDNGECGDCFQHDYPDCPLE